MLHRYFFRLSGYFAKRAENCSVPKIRSIGQPDRKTLFEPNFVAKYQLHQCCAVIACSLIAFSLLLSEPNLCFPLRFFDLGKVWGVYRIQKRYW